MTTDPEQFYKNLSKIPSIDDTIYPLILKNHLLQDESDEDERTTKIDEIAKIFQKLQKCPKIINYDYLKCLEWSVGDDEIWGDFYGPKKVTELIEILFDSGWVKIFKFSMTKFYSSKKCLKINERIS